jgi:2-iminobutanoate/2-iminopropanoate deaminase
MMTRTPVNSPDAPAPIGPYSQAMMAGGFLFVSGQIALDTRTNELVAGGIEEQTEQVLKNIAAILRSAGSSFAQAVRAEIFLTDLAHFSQVNAIYVRYFREEPRPARFVVQVAALPKNALIEIALIATCA